MTVHSFSTQYNTEQFQTNIIAQLLSIVGEGQLIQELVSEDDAAFQAMFK